MEEGRKVGGILKNYGGFSLGSRKCVPWEMMPDEASDLSGAELEAVPWEENDLGATREI